jgi:hypothetical protein
MGRGTEIAGTGLDPVAGGIERTPEICGGKEWPQASRRSARGKGGGEQAGKHGAASEDPGWSGHHIRDQQEACHETPSHFGTAGSPHRPECKVFSSSNFG